MVKEQGSTRAEEKQEGGKQEFYQYPARLTNCGCQMCRASKQIKKIRFHFLALLCCSVLHSMMIISR